MFQSPFRSAGSRGEIRHWDLPPSPKNSQNISTLHLIVKVPLMQPKQNVLTLFTQNCIISFDLSSMLLATANFAQSFSFGSIPLILWGLRGVINVVPDSLTIQYKKYFFHLKNIPQIPQKQVSFRQKSVHTWPAAHWALSAALEGCYRSWGIAFALSHF